MLLPMKPFFFFVGLEGPAMCGFRYSLGIGRSLAIGEEGEQRKNAIDAKESERKKERSRDRTISSKSLVSRKPLQRSCSIHDTTQHDARYCYRGTYIGRRSVKFTSALASSPEIENWPVDITVVIQQQQEKALQDHPGRRYKRQ